jgi:hypothetical protein
VRIARILITVCVLGAPAWVWGQAAAATPRTPEAFSGTAQAKNASGAVSGTIEVVVSRYTPDFDRKTVEEALRLGGYPRFLPALRNAPQVGQLVLAGSAPYVIRYAREKVEAGVRTITLVTDRPVFFVGSGRTESKPRAGYELAVLQFQVDATGKGHGTMAGAARVRPDGAGGVVLDDYAETPIELLNITRKPL